MFEVRKYRTSDCRELHEVLRETDITYLEQVTRMDALSALESFYDNAEEAYTFHVNGKVAALLGVTCDNCWLQTSRLTDGHAKAVIKAGRAALHLLPQKPAYCVIPKDDKRVQLLCKALGFTVQTVEYEDYMGSGIDHIALWRIP